MLDKNVIKTKNKNRFTKRKKIKFFNVDYVETDEEQELRKYKYVKFLEDIYDDFLNTKYPKR